MCMQGAAQLFIQVIDDDTYSSDDHVDDIYIEGLLAPSDVFTEYDTYIGQYSNSRIQLRFRVQCDTGYYGFNCARYCMKRNDENGHYTCDQNGNRICLGGWIDSNRECTTGKYVSFVLLYSLTNAALQIQGCCFMSCDCMCQYKHYHCVHVL